MGGFLEAGGARPFDPVVAGVILKNLGNQQPTTAMPRVLVRIIARGALPEPFPPQEIRFFVYDPLGPERQRLLPSGGSSDSMTLAVAHRDADGTVILDCVQDTRPPFSPESVVEEFAAVLASYHIGTVTGDRYAGEWPREQFAKRGIEYRISDRPKTELYQAFLPLLNSRRARLLDNQRLLKN